MLKSQIFIIYLSNIVSVCNIMSLFMEYFINVRSAVWKNVKRRDRT